MTLLGIDYGDKRIGLSKSDGLGITAQPLGYLSNNANIFNELLKTINEHHITKIIMGLPKDPKGNDSKKSLDVRAFSENISKHCSLPIEFWDERFSTIAVTRHLIDADLSRKKRKQVVDTAAATYILQGYLDKENFHKRNIDTV